MAVQRLVLIHPRELKIPTLQDINPVTKMKALPEDSKKVFQDAEVKKVAKEEKNDPEDVASNGKALETEEPENIQLYGIFSFQTAVSNENTCP